MTINDFDFDYDSEKNYSLRKEEEDKRVEGRTGIELEEGYGIVPIFKPAMGSRALKGERREDLNILRYANARGKESLVNRIITYKAQMVVAYGFNLELKPTAYGGTESVKEGRKRFFTNWAEKKNLKKIIKDMVESVQTYGDWFGEKIYADEGFPKGWGIKEVRTLHPYSMFVDRGNKGDIINYYQKPVDARGRRTIWTPDDFRKDGIKIPPYKMIHWKYNDFTNKTYGTSDIKPLIETLNMKKGVVDDMCLMTQRRASPFLHWKVGTPETGAPARIVETLRNNIQQFMGNPNSFDIFTSGNVTVDVIAAGNEVMDVIPILNFFNSEIIKALGFPEIFLGEGEGSGEASAKAQIEVFARMIMSIQHEINNLFMEHLFIDLIIKEEDRGKEISPDLWENVPYIKWKTIVPVSDSRLMLESEIKWGARTIEEARVELGLPEDYDENNLSPQNRKFLADIIQKDRELDIAEKTAENAVKIAENNQNSGNNGSNTQNSEKSRQKSSFGEF